MNTKILKCKSCNGTMEMDEERPILFCPYCGSKELVEESDEVIKARIDANTKVKINEQKLKHKEEIKKLEIKNSQNDQKMLFILTIGGFLLVGIITVMLCLTQ